MRPRRQRAHSAPRLRFLRGFEAARTFGVAKIVLWLSLGSSQAWAHENDTPRRFWISGPVKCEAVSAFGHLGL